MSVPASSAPVKAGVGKGEQLELLPSLAPMPWEDLTQFEAFGTAVFAELSPTTPHQRALAQRIFEELWDQYRNRELSRDVFLHAYRQAAIHILSATKFMLQLEPWIPTLVDGLISSDQNDRADALKALAEHGVTEEQIRAKAYIDHMAAIETLERRSIRQDERRRALVKEYRELKQMAGLATVPDAEQLPSHGD